MPSDSPSPAVALADTISEILYGIAGWLSIGFGLLAAVAVVPQLLQRELTTHVMVGTTFWLLSAFVLVALGVFVNPRFRRRLNRRHAPSEFGRVRSVDRRVVRPEENCIERCVSCRSRVEKGLVRRYREEYAVAGVPVYTISEGYNHYCLECATRDVLGERPGDAGDASSARGDRIRDRELDTDTVTDIGTETL